MHLYPLSDTPLPLNNVLYVRQSKNVTDNNEKFKNFVIRKSSKIKYN